MWNMKTSANENVIVSIKKLYIIHEKQLFVFYWVGVVENEDDVFAGASNL